MFARLRSALPTVPPELASLGAHAAISWGLATLQRQADDSAAQLEQLREEIATSQTVAGVAAAAVEARRRENEQLQREIDARAAELQRVTEELEAHRRIVSARLTEMVGSACSCTAESCTASVHSWSAADADPLERGESDG